MANRWRAGSDFKKALERAAKEISKVSNMRALGLVVADMIRVRTRLGYGVDGPGAKRKKLKKLSKIYIEERKEDEGLSEFTTAGRSNLTRTGQLLESVGVESVKTGSVNVAPSGRRRDGLDNKDVGEFVTKQGRAFNNLSNIEQKRIETQIKRDMEKILKSQLTKLK